MGEWRVYLAGHKYDLQELISLFQTHVIEVSQETDSEKFYFSESHLNSDLWAEAKNEMIRQKAEELISVINAIAVLQDSSFQPVKFDGLSYVSDDGSKSTVVFLETIQSRSRFFPPTVVIDGAVSDSLQKRYLEIARLIELANHNTDIAKAFRLYGSLEPSWRNLYLVLETVEKAVGGQGNLLKQTWLTDISGMKEAIELFKHTSNSYAAIGAEARHAKESIIPPETPMTIDEARTVIRTLLNEWVKTKL